MKKQIQYLSLQIQKPKEDSIQNKELELELKKGIQDYLKKFGGINIEINDISISSREEIEDLFEENKNEKEDKEESEDQEKIEEPEELDLSLIDDIQEEVEKNNIKKAIEKEKQIIKEWEEKYPKWAKENLDKIIFHKDGIEFNIKGLEGKKFQRENLKVEKSGFFNKKLPKGVFEISVDDLELTDKQKEELRGEQLFTWEVGLREVKKKGLGIPSDEQWSSLVEFMPGKNKDERYVNLISILDLRLSGYHDTNGNFYRQGFYGYYWSSTAYLSSNSRGQYFYTSGGSHLYNDKDSGLSVRCFKD